MGWFKKKVVAKPVVENPTKLPELPKLPEMPDIQSKDMDFKNEPASQLPSYPTNSFGEKFSQNAIKEAVTGKKGDKEVFDADEPFDEDEDREMQKPQKDLKERIPMGNIPRNFPTQKTLDPVFVRLDKFEESLAIFNKTKNKISEIEKLLGEMKRINEKEEKELLDWEKEVQKMKKNFEKIDEDIFSKI